MEEAKETDVVSDGAAASPIGTEEKLKAAEEMLARIEELTSRLADMGTRIDELSCKIEKRERVESLIGELRELPRLFPGADALSIDDEGWQSIAEGGSVLAAFVRSEHRKKLAAEANKAGAAASAGAISGGIGAVYSVDEIRQMDRSTVRKNLDKVLSSLEAVGG